MSDNVAAVYKLKCADGSYYVGSTKDYNIVYRVDQHNAGFGGKYTASRRPVELIWAQTFERYIDAFSAERQIKGWSRAKKEALIASNWESVRHLSKRRGGKDRREDPSRAPAAPPQGEGLEGRIHLQPEVLGEAEPRRRMTVDA